MRFKHIDCEQHEMRYTNCERRFGLRIHGENRERMRVDNPCRSQSVLLAIRVARNQCIRISCCWQCVLLAIRIARNPCIAFRVARNPCCSQSVYRIFCCSQSMCLTRINFRKLIADGMISGHILQDNHFRTLCFRTTISGQPFQDNHFKTTISNKTTISGRCVAKRFVPRHMFQDAIFSWHIFQDTQHNMCGPRFPSYPVLPASDKPGSSIPIWNNEMLAPRSPSRNTLPLSLALGRKWA